jgi:hypothetical protein
MRTSGKKDFPVAEVPAVSGARPDRPRQLGVEGQGQHEVVKAHAATAPRYPRTIHYRGEGVFMISGPNTRRYRKLFRPEML